MKIKLRLFKFLITLLFVGIFSICLHGQENKKQGEVINWSYYRNIHESLIDSRQNQLLKEDDLGYYEYRVLWAIDQWNNLRTATILETKELLVDSDTIIVTSIEKSFSKFLISADKLWQEKMNIKINEPPGNEIHIHISDDVLAEIAWTKLIFTSSYAQTSLNNYLILKKYENKK